jgi:hypothetical protein
VIVVRDGLRTIGGLIQTQGDSAIPAPVAPLPLAPGGAPPAGNPIVEPAPLGVPGQFSPDMAAPKLCLRVCVVFVQLVDDCPLALYDLGNSNPDWPYFT